MNSEYCTSNFRRIAFSVITVCDLIVWQVWTGRIGEASPIPIPICQKVGEAIPILIPNPSRPNFVGILPPLRYLAHSCCMIRGLNRPKDFVSYDNIWRLYLDATLLSFFIDFPNYAFTSKFTSKIVGQGFFPSSYALIGNKTHIPSVAPHRETLIQDATPTELLGLRHVTP